MGDLFEEGDKEGVQLLVEVSVGANAYFYNLARRGSMEYRDFNPREETPRAIQRVGVAHEKRKKIQRIFERFPHTWPVPEQGAYILRAYSGLQIFPDANHRTGLSISRLYLGQNQFELRATSDEATELVDAIRSPRSPLYARCNAGQLLDRNSAFLHIAAFYRDHLRKLSTVRSFAAAVRGVFGRPEAELRRFTAWEDPTVEAARKTSSVDDDRLLPP